ncbi:ABC transporter ATP-binding protein [Gorillibacterium timonense]|uniref:ABC transporter ATP-binding protein n=1 Tax=Gorillibacterium timonense TaxID=1689269 RepID=UPI00131AAC36|nr:ABC transporter ATP-binding protein [Gorillibacterium timonense]
MILQLDQAGKRFGSKQVLESIDLSIGSGECVAIKGRNGMGKSTLLRLAAGIDRPSSGRVEFGVAKREIGYVPDRFPHLRFTLNEYLTYMGRIRGMSPNKLQRRVQELASFAGLTADADRQIRYYSKGMLQKSAILQALIEQPQLLLMDEPMSGLDKSSREDVLLFLSRLRSEGMAILFSSHEDHWVTKLADRVYQLENGMLLLQEASEGDRDFYTRLIIEVEHLPETVACKLADELPPLQAAAIREATSTLTGLRIEADPAYSDELLLALLRSGGSVRSVREHVPALVPEKGGGQIG